ncbi:MAG: NAD(P)-dependent oxidoreductase [Candidatus Cloacimonetes bacterium]|nr:NAD(P)-dependent oxidoreductase [Candidatus Cloacimonadota bacterium]
MKKKILLTGITGFIGRNVARVLLNNGHELICPIRPDTSQHRWQDFQDKITTISLDLSDIKQLRDFLSANCFDAIVHIAALRGGRKYSRDQYFQVNVNSTEQLIINAMANQSQFLFCSSVGVFGAIPSTLPANNRTPKIADNYYHFTKIRAEQLIQNYVLKGLKAVIIRPSITYGAHDFGFPFTLTKLIEKKLLFLPNTPVKIHLTNIDLLEQAFEKALDIPLESGSEFIVADAKPVDIHDLANYISSQIHGKPYSRNRVLSPVYFRMGEKLADALHSDLWKARFELISRSWFYDVSESMNILNLKKIDTIPAFKTVTDWYKKL